LKAVSVGKSPDESLAARFRDKGEDILLIPFKGD